MTSLAAYKREIYTNKSDSNPIQITHINAPVHTAPKTNNKGPNKKAKNNKIMQTKKNTDREKAFEKYKYASINKLNNSMKMRKKNNHHTSDSWYISSSSFCQYVSFEMSVHPFSTAITTKYCTRRSYRLSSSSSKHSPSGTASHHR